MILQYLTSNGYIIQSVPMRIRFNTAAVVLQEEANMRSQNHSNCIPLIRSVKSMVMNGEWEEVESIIRKHVEEK